ncbi:MAG TPA: extracellular solute-binding protein [Stellaceae bacterium]|nr:extracellular solute-binding protein [Stellaceae bacterium]
MSQRETDLFDSYIRQDIGRRDLVKRAVQLGLGGTAAGILLNLSGTRALAATDFNWQKYKGTGIKLLLNKHPYTDAMIADLENFKQLTGMTVTYDVFPEDVYFDKVTAALSSRSTQYDAFMTGAYQTWQYGPAGWLVDVNEFLKDPGATAQTYKWDDILPNLRASTAWSGVPGAPLGAAGSKQWAVPWGFELNSVSYNRRIFDQLKLQPPKHLPDLLEVAERIVKDGKGPYGIGVRGSRSWATIHPGYLSGLVNYGGTDFTVTDGKLKAAMNSKPAKEFTRMWIDMIRKSGPRNWTNYTWYEVGNDLGAGTSGMIFDADILGYFQQNGTKEAGNIAFQAFAANPAGTAPTPNVWIWSLAISNFSRNKPAAWNFIQWASGTDHCTFGATKADQVNPVRQSVWDNADFQGRLKAKYPGYLEQYQASAPNAKIYFTPQPLFFNLTTDWAAALQKMFANEVPVDEGLDQLALSIDGQLKNAGIAD